MTHRIRFIKGVALLVVSQSRDNRRMDALAGKLLLANGSLFGETFRQTVILMADHGDEGALGFVLNRPTKMVVSEESPVTEIGAIEETVFSGGPVQQGLLSVIAEFETPDLSPRVIFGTVGFLDLEITSQPGIKRARVFAGYSGWGPGQLENEIEEGSWVITDPTVDLIFEIPYEQVWQEALRRMGGEYALMATMPYDPGMN